MDATADRTLTEWTTRKEKALAELKRLEAMPNVSAEATVSRNYIEWLVGVPWKKASRELKDLTRAEQILNVTLGNDRFPFLAKGRVIVVRKIDLFACSSELTDYHAILSYIAGDGDPVTSTPELILSPNDAYGGLHKVTIDATDAGLDLEDMDTSAPISLKIKRVAAPDYTSLATGPDELNDVLVVLHYSLDQG
jgi:hypothetical protein